MNVSIAPAIRFVYILFSNCFHQLADHPIMHRSWGRCSSREYKADEQTACNRAVTSRRPSYLSERQVRAWDR